MGPQFVDFDGDGHLDIVTATYDGSPHLARGGASGFAKPRHILDAKGQRILLSQYWCYEDEEWKRTGTPHCVSAVAHDWDGDGDHDLLLGAKDAGLFLQRNEGSDAEPKFSGKNEKVLAGGEHLVVPGGLTAPRRVDWNGDGRLDLVCGSFGGGAYLYLDEAEQGAPQFAAAVTLIEPRAIDGQPSSGCYVDPVDLDGDGDLDLLVGGYAQSTPKAAPLDAGQRDRVAAAQAKMEEVQKKMQALMDGFQEQLKGLDPAEAAARQRELLEGEKFLALQDEFVASYQIVQGSQSSSARRAGVWMYERL